MLTENRWALKEWAVVCAALAQGRQTLMLRKGGIAEGPGGFRVEHPEFWLVPTRFHQSAAELQADAASLVAAAAALMPPPDRLRLPLYAQVVDVRRIDVEAELDELIPQQVLSAPTIRDRFHYRQPGLWALLLRVYRVTPPPEIPDRAEYAGCHSWVELESPLAVPPLTPVLGDDEFRATLQPTSSARFAK